MYTDVKFGTFGAGEIEIDAGEFGRRSGGCSLDMDAVVECRKDFDKALGYRYAFAGMKVDFPEEGVCDFGFAKIKSRDLYKNLKGCTHAYMMAITLGAGVDRLMAKLRIKSAGKLLITDALASAAAESLCDRVDAMIKEQDRFVPGGRWRPRYSPGYGDCGIENQKLLFERLDCEKNLGITLNESYFMTPAKSITAIMGIRNEEDN